MPASSSSSAFAAMSSGKLKLVPTYSTLNVFGMKQEPHIYFILALSVSLLSSNLQICLTFTSLKLFLTMQN